MKLKQTLVSIAIIMVAAVAVGSLVSTSVYAADPAENKLDCAVLPQDICDSAEAPDLGNNGIWKILMLVLRVMTGSIGIAAIGAIAYGGFLYATAQDNASQTSQAKEMIRNTLIGVVLYGLMYVAMEFLVPGGVFGS